MIWLLLFFAVNLVYRVTFEGTMGATVSSVILALAIYLARSFGGWSSPQSALEWLKQQRGFGLPLIAGPILVFVLAVISDRHNPVTAAIETIWVYIFFHGCLAGWVALISKLQGRSRTK